MKRHARSGAAFAAAGAAALLVLAACGTAPRRPAVPPVPPPPRDVHQVPDAVPRPEPRSARGNPPFYDVMGRRYYVLASAAGYLERGVASWYGPGFHAARTSNGETYDMYAMSAAHKSLPLPSYARVTNLANGRSVVVRINDRGPFVANRIIDLSYAAAARLDMLREGTALVEVSAIDTGGAAEPLLAATNAPPPATPRAAAGGPLYVQAGAFADVRNASRLADRLQAAGFTNAFVRAYHEAGRSLHRVRIGPVASVAEFDRVIARLAALGLRDARLAID